MAGKYLVMMEVTEDQAIRASTKANVRGVYKMPRSFCNELNHGKQRGFTKGQRFGWWVCHTCRKPSRPYWTRIFEDNVFGYNLKERITE